MNISHYAVAAISPALFNCNETAVSLRHILARSVWVHGLNQRNSTGICERPFRRVTSLPIVYNSRYGNMVNGRTMVAGWGRC